MIDPHWQLVDLDPITWRNIGKFIDPGLYIRAGSSDERGLYVIHDGGNVLSVVETSGQSRKDLRLDRVESPRALAEALHATRQWDRVHVIDRQHLNEVSSQAQQLENRELDLDAYYHRVFRLIWGNGNGYVALPPHPRHWHGWTYQQIVEFVDQLETPASLALGVVSDDATTLEIGLIAEVSHGRFRKITTFEALPFPRAEAAVSAAYMDRLWSHLSNGAWPPAVVLLCTSAVFDTWVYDANKRATLDAALADGKAVLRLRASPPLRLPA